MPISYAVRQEDNQHALCGSDYTSPIRALVSGWYFTPSERAGREWDPPFVYAELMAGIARNIKLYNSAYSLAWKHISERQKRERPDIARRLHDSIRRLLKDGETEPLFIASEALKALEESEPGTPKAESAKQALPFCPWWHFFGPNPKRKGPGDGD
jgi:hypothetical protein